MTFKIWQKTTFHSFIPLSSAVSSPIDTSLSFRKSGKDSHHSKDRSFSKISTASPTTSWTVYPIVYSSSTITSYWKDSNLTRAAVELELSSCPKSPKTHKFPSKKKRLSADTAKTSSKTAKVLLFWLSCCCPYVCRVFFKVLRIRQVFGSLQYRIEKMLYLIVTDASLKT